MDERIINYLIEDHDSDQVDDGGRERCNEAGVAGKDGALGRVVQGDDDGNAVEHDGEHRHQDHNQLKV